MSRNISRFLASLLVVLVSECWAAGTLTFSPPIPNSGEPFTIQADFQLPALACSRSRNPVVTPSAGALNVTFLVTCVSAATPTTFGDLVAVSGLPSGNYVVTASLVPNIGFPTPPLIDVATGLLQVVPAPIPMTSPTGTGVLAVLLVCVGIAFLLRSRRNA